MALFKHFMKVEKEDYESLIESELGKLKDEMSMENCSTASVEKRPPGRPRKRIEMDSSTLSSSGFTSSCSSSPSGESDTLSDTCAAPSDSKKLRRIDWFTSPLIHDIVEEVRVCRSAFIAVERLKRKFPRLPTEEKGRFDDLKENTVRYWFKDDWTLKDQFAALVKNKKGGRRQYFTAEIERKIIEHLTKLREKGQTMHSFIIGLVMKAVLTAEHEEKTDMSPQFCRNFVKEKLGWSWRSVTTGNKLPEDWMAQGIVMLKRIAIHIDTINAEGNGKFHPSLLINFDQTAIHLVPKSKYTFAPTKSKGCSGEDDKRQITGVLASSATGEMLPMQFIYEGTTQRCEAKPLPETTAAHFHLTHSPNHWSSQTTMREYIQEIIEPYVRDAITRYGLSANAKAILLLDSWSVHTSDEFRNFMKTKRDKFILVYIPACCTSKLQVADTHLNFVFKHGVRRQFNAASAERMLQSLQKNEEIEKMDVTMGALKPNILKWCFESWKSIKLDKAYVIHAWDSLFKIFNPFEEENQRKALRDLARNQFQLEEDLEAAEDEDFDPPGHAGDAYDGESEDEAKDELDIMREIRTGARRSTRSRQPPQFAGYMFRTDQIQMEHDEEDHA